MRYLPEVNAFAGSDHDGLAQVMWHVTDACPLSCPYCFATKSGRAVRAGDIDELASVLAKLGVLKVDIGGGEPLTYRHLAQLVGRVSELGMRMTITTSGAGAPTLRLWLFSNLKYFTRVIISVDGPMALHDKLRGRTGAYDAAWDLARRIIASGYSGTRINTVVTSRLLTNGALPALAQEIAELGPAEWCLIQPHAANALATFHDYSVTDADFTEAASLASRLVEDRLSRVTILTRRSIDYTGYWVLYPDRSLRVHTMGEHDHVGAQDVLDIDAVELKRIIRTRGQSFPPVTVETVSQEQT